MLGRCCGLGLVPNIVAAGHLEEILLVPLFESLHFLLEFAPMRPDAFEFGSALLDLDLSTTYSSSSRVVDVCQGSSRGRG